MTIGFLLDGPDNDSYMLGGPGSPPVCGTCGLVSDRAWIDPGFQLRDKRFDVSATYDGYLIVSERFREIADGPGARFIALPSATGFYSLIVDNAVPFDAARRKTRFEQLCAECGRYFVVAGATPAFLKVDSLAADQLYRTDVEFGTGNEQHPLIAVGTAMGDRLRAARLAGLDLSPVRHPGW